MEQLSFKRVKKLDGRKSKVTHYGELYNHCYNDNEKRKLNN